MTSRTAGTLARSSAAHINKNQSPRPLKVKPDERLVGHGTRVGDVYRLQNGKLIYIAPKGPTTPTAKPLVRRLVIPAPGARGPFTVRTLRPWRGGRGAVAHRVSHTQTACRNLPAFRSFE
jgi:hypothetical protein